MKTFTTLALALAACALTAQEPVGKLDVRVLAFTEITRPRSYEVTPGLKDQAGRQLGFGFRLLGELPNTSGWYYELGGRFDSSSSLSVNNALVNNKDIDVKYSYWSAGGAYLFSFGPGTLGLHMEARGERIALVGEQFDGAGVSMGKVSQSTTYVRPWAKASFDLTVPIGKARPFVGGEAAIALTRTLQERSDALTSTDNNDRMARSFAPEASVNFYIGLRF